MRNVLLYSELVFVLILCVEGCDILDWLVVWIFVDGEDLFEQVVLGWGGFDLDDILGLMFLLLVFEGVGCRVVVYWCFCGEVGCGVIVFIIIWLFYLFWVEWMDFCNYVGVFFYLLFVVGEDMEVDNIG